MGRRKNNRKTRKVNAIAKETEAISRSLSIFRKNLPQYKAIRMTKDERIYMRLLTDANHMIELASQVIMGKRKDVNGIYSTGGHL